MQVAPTGSTTALDIHMPARSAKSTWDFGPVVELNNNLSYYDVDQSNTAIQERPSGSDHAVAPNSPVLQPSLGNFGKLFKALGVPPNLSPQVPPLSAVELQEAYNSDGALYHSPDNTDAEGTLGSASMGFSTSPESSQEHRSDVERREDANLNDSPELSEDPSITQVTASTKKQRKKKLKKQQKVVPQRKQQKANHTERLKLWKERNGASNEKDSRADADGSSHSTVTLGKTPLPTRVNAMLSDDESLKRTTSTTANTPARKASVHTILLETHTPVARYDLRSSARHSTPVVPTQNPSKTAPPRNLKIVSVDNAERKQSQVIIAQPASTASNAGFVQTPQTQLPAGTATISSAAQPMVMPRPPLHPHASFTPGLLQKRPGPVPAPMFVPSQVAHLVTPPVHPYTQQYTQQQYCASSVLSPSPHFQGHPSYFPNQPSPYAVHQYGLQPSPLPSATAFRSNVLTIRHGEDRHWHFLLKLLGDFGEDRKWLVHPMQLSNNQASSTGIHVFVDASNILIGFGDTLKRLHGMHPKTRPPAVDISFDSLVLLMERRRPVAKRILVGSSPLLPAFDMAKAIGYELNILDKVYKAKELTERQKFFQKRDMKGWKKPFGRNSAPAVQAGSSSEPEMVTAQQASPPEKWHEQGVDEIIHLKILESIVDVEVPTTIVLATGDAAEAEYSGGFLVMVERALNKGWKVELISWRQNISGQYRKSAFQTKWKDQFRIIELDGYAEDLLNT